MKFKFCGVKNELEDQRLENNSLRAKIQCLNEEKNKMSERIQSLENQLVTAIEKHKACQNEVSQRDQNLIKLQSDLNILQEKYSSCVEEVRIQQEEIDRLNARTKKQSSDFKELQAAYDALEDKNTCLEKHIKQLEYELEITKLNVANHERTIENIKTEWANNIRNHEEEVKGYKQNYQILSEDLSNTKSELNDYMNKVNCLKQKVAELNIDLDTKTQLNENLNSDLNKYEFICKEQEAKICQYCTDISMLKGHLDHANSQIGQMNVRYNELETKYDHALKAIDKLEASVNCLNEVIMELKFKMAEKEQAVEICRADVNSLNQQLNNKNLDLKKLIQQNESLNEELDKANEDSTRLTECLEHAESSYKTIQAKLNEKIQDVRFNSPTNI